MVQHLKQASQWLTHRRRWRADELIWSVHKEHRRLDRAGKGASGKFWYLAHEDLVNLVTFDLTEHIHVWAGGELRHRLRCIPMGGSFSAQSADLHSAWGVFQGRHLFRKLGKLHISESGFVYWINELGTVSLCQFRDNILVASTYPDSPRTQLIHQICGILHECWGLRVVCDCGDVCQGSCLKQSTTAMGYGLHRGTDGKGLAHLHPSSVSDIWTPKLGPPLCTPGSQPKNYLKSIFTSVLTSSVPWCATWAGQLLSVMSWAQVAVLAGYCRKHTARRMHSAVQRAYGDTVHDSTLTAAYVHHTMPLLPMPRCCHIDRVTRYIEKHAV